MLRLIFVLLLLPSVLFAIPCTGGSNPPILKTISIDGDASDWTEILANASQTTIDGFGSVTNVVDCSTLSTDRDCKVGSTGRDLDMFSWTYDNDNIYLFQTRYGSTANVQDFWFYMDVNGDQKMSADDFLLRVNYKGSNRNVSSELFRYSPVDPAGDEMVNVSKFADGYDMPGSLGVNIKTYSTVFSGLADGSGFEVAVPWADLGVSAGTKIYFHLSGSNGTNLPGSIDDNAGGINGGIGCFCFTTLDISPDHLSSMQDGATVSYLHDATNSGSTAQTINLATTSSAGFRVDLYSAVPPQLMGTDRNGDGDYIDGTDYLNSAFDSDGDHYPDTGLLPAGSTFQVSVMISAPSGHPTVTDSTVITGQSSLASDCATDTTAVGRLLVEADQSKKVVAGVPVTFSHTLTHSLLADTFKLAALSANSWSVSFYDSANVLMATDANGDGDYSDAGDFVAPAYDTNADGYPDTGNLNPGAVFAFKLEWSVPPGLPADIAGEVTVYGIATSINGKLLDTATDQVIVKPAISLNPNYLISDGTNFYAAAGQDVFFPHMVVNSASYDDTADLTYTADAGTTVQFWSDPNCDGNIDDAVLINTVGPLPANGGSKCLIVQVLVPQGVAKGTTIQAIPTATSQSDHNQWDTAVDEIAVSQLVPYEDALFTKPNTRFAHCQTVYLKGFNFHPTDVLTLRYLDPNSVEQRAAQVIVNGLGQITDQYTFSATDLSRSWTITIETSSGTILDTIYITLPPDFEVNTIDPLTTLNRLHSMSSNVAVSSTLNNMNAQFYANYLNTTLKTVILANDNSVYWNGASFQPYTGTEWSRTLTRIDVYVFSSVTDVFTFSGVTFPSPGIWKIKASWVTSCGYEIAQSENVFLVGTTLATYSDNTYTVPKNIFYLHDPVYLAGNNFNISSNFKLAFYDVFGRLITTSSVLTDLAGRITQDQTTPWDAEGIVEAVVFPMSITPPAIQNPAHPWRLGSTVFTLIRLPGLLRNADFAVKGPSIFVNYPNDPSLDRIADMEKEDFRPRDPFSHEFEDMTITSPYLIFYQLNQAGRIIYLQKQEGRITIHW